MKRRRCWLIILFLLIAALVGACFLAVFLPADASDAGKRKQLLLDFLAEHQIVGQLKTGDVICRKGNGIWSDLFSRTSHRDQRFSHVGIVLVEGTGEVSVVHAEGNDYTGAGEVIEQSLVDFLLGGNGAQVYRLKPQYGPLADGEDIAQQVRGYKGMPFDCSFDLEHHEALYCTEFAAVAIEQMAPKVTLKTGELRGKNFMPVDSFNDPEFFQEICPIDKP